METVFHRDGRVSVNGLQVASWLLGEDGMYHLMTEHPTRPALSEYEWQTFRHRSEDLLSYAPD